MRARRSTRGMTLFALGFRPFFLGAAIWAAAAVPAWLWMLSAGHDPGGSLTPRAWHVHEMIFGYTGAVIAGFALTAIPNWTGRLPVAGPPLAALFGLWLAGRVVLVAPWPGFPFAAVIDAAFLFVLAGVAWREIVAGGNWRNLPVCLLITLIAVANAGFHTAVAAGWDESVAVRVALAMIVMLIGLIGGRITPSFTRNWMAKRQPSRRPVPFGRFDGMCLVALAAALVAWNVAPMAVYAGSGLLCVGGLHLLRLARWCGWATTAEPLVLVLHVGYLWLPVSMILLGLSALPGTGIDASSALHALTAGLIGTMTLAVMTRATLGHSGRALTAGPATTAIYGLVVGGAILRVIASYLPVDYLATVGLAGALWSAGFALFVIVYGPLLLFRRPARSPTWREAVGVKLPGRR